MAYNFYGRGIRNMGEAERRVVQQKEMGYAIQSFSQDSTPPTLTLHLNFVSIFQILVEGKDNGKIGRDTDILLRGQGKKC